MTNIHKITNTPSPANEPAIFVNEPVLTDYAIETASGLPEDVPGNIRIYVPIDINLFSIKRKLGTVIRRYENEATFDNESRFECEVEQILSLVEIYDQIMCDRNHDEPGTHCAEVLEMMQYIVERLEGIEDISSECFPFDMIRRLKKDYFGIEEE